MTTSRALTLQFYRCKAFALLTALFFSSFFNLHAQGWDKYFGGNKEDLGHAVIQTSDLGYLLIGYSESFANGPDQDLDVYAVKTDVDGTVVWEKTFDPGFTEFARSVVQTPDEGFLIAGEVSFDAVNGPFEGLLIKVSRDGKQEWVKTFSYPEEGIVGVRVNDIVLAPDGGYLMAGYVQYEDVDDDILLIKTDAEGEQEWVQFIDSGRDEQAEAAAVMGDGFVITGREDSPFPPPITFGTDIVTYRVDAAGSVLWEARVATLEEEAGNDVLVDGQGRAVVAGFIGNNRNVGIWRYDDSGALADSVVVDFFGQSDAANAIIPGPDGGYVIGGSTEVNGANVDMLIAAFDASLNLEWFNNNGDDFNTDEALGIAPTSRGGYVMVGSSGSLLNFVNDVVLTLTDANGLIHSNYIRGKVFHDIDLACDMDPGEPALKGWLVRATNAMDNEVFYSATDENGRFEIRVDTGDYILEALPLNAYWETCLPNGVNIVFEDTYDDITVNFPIQAVIPDCPLMQVDVSTPFLSNCTNIEYTVAYENTGTGDAEAGAMVSLTFDPLLTFESASLPFVVEDGVYQFDLGSVPYNEGGSFTVSTQMACEGIVEGQAAYVSARIFPDSTCLPLDPNWNGASVGVDGLCKQEEGVIEFGVSNTGTAAMSAARDFFIVEEDLVVFLTQPFELGPLEDTVVALPATGATYRIVAEQVEGHPGSLFPTKAVEGCGTNDEGTYSTGFVTQWPENDADPAASVHVDEIFEEQPEVYMTAHPKGLRDSVITAETALTYRIFFRNIGEDTLTRAVIRDTLPEELDITTVTLGASSHPVDFEVYHTGVIKATFNGLQLPVAAEGVSTSDYAYLEFQVRQRPGNSAGTVINNRAQVIFDYYAPVETNLTHHVIEALDYGALLEAIPVDIDVPDWAENATIKVYPNPASAFITLEVVGIQGAHSYQFTLLNMNGQPVRQKEVDGAQCIIHREGLPAGSYIYLVRADGEKVAAGTLIIR